MATDLITIAVAGGTGKLGRTIAEVVGESSKHRVVILSRKPSEESDIKQPVITVDYDNTDALIQILEESNVHTIISTIQVSSKESGNSEIGLARAASMSKTTKRFISSNWSMPIPDEYKHLDLPAFAPRALTTDYLRTTDLEWTTIYNGMLMDYFGTPNIKSYMGVFAIHIDMLNKVAAIPGTGDDILTFAYSFDVARFVDAALDLDQWEEKYFCYSDKRSYNEVLRLAEKARDSPFNVTYDDAQKLEKGEMTELPFHTSLYPYRPKSVLQVRFSRFGLMAINKLFQMPEEETLNHLFPQIRTTSVDEIIDSWKGK